MKRKRKNSERDGKCLIQAVCQQSLPSVQKLLDDGVPINFKDEKGLTSLHWACYHDTSEIAGLLMYNGADLNSKDDNGKTPLHICIATKHTEPAKLLIEHGVNPNVKDKDGNTPLQVECKDSGVDEAMVKLLIEGGGNVNETDKLGKSVLMNLAYSGCSYRSKWWENLMVIKLLIANGVDLNVRDRLGMTVLHLACEQYDCTLSRLLLENGADVHCKDGANGNTAVHFACKRRDWETVKLLKEYGADLAARDRHGNTLLHLAYNRHTRFDKKIMKWFKWLIQNGVDVNGKCGKGRTMLHRACFDEHWDLVKLLVEYGCADINVKDNGGVTPLYWVCKAWTTDVEIVQLLLSKGANVCAKTRHGKTPLLEACERKCFDTTWHLIRHRPLLIAQSYEKYYKSSANVEQSK